MPLRKEVNDAFQTLQLQPDADYQLALKAYKRLALIHHPDRNHGDESATERFQQIGAAWNICQRHYDNPAWSHVQFEHPTPSYASSHHFNPFDFDDDEDDDNDGYYFMDEEDIHAYYMFMFAETLANRFSRAKGKHYRHQRSRASHPGVYSFHRDSSEFSQQSQAAQQERQRREKEEYEKRKRELELEIEEEERQKQKAEKDAQADQDRRASLVDSVFQAAYAGDSSSVRKIILDNDLNVNTPRKRAKHTRKQDEVVQHDSLLHVAASHCDEDLVMFLVERGADTKLLNKQQLTPFHAAIKAGNTRVVRFIMERRGRSFEGYHPSKAAPSGCTPLQLAIDSQQPSTIELLVREATTHDVGRCWKQEGLSEDIKNILRTKKGFVPPEEEQEKQAATQSSKKGHRMTQQKAAQLALEQERAEKNRQKREERAAKRAEQEREQLAKQEAEERAREEAEFAEKRRLEEEELRRHQESLRKAEEAKAEEQRRLEAERLAEEKERARKVEVERQRQEEVRKSQEEAKQRNAVIEAQRRTQEQNMARRKQEEQTAKERDAQTGVSTRPPVRQPVKSTSQASNSNPHVAVKRERLTEEEIKAIKREKQRERRKNKAAARAQSEHDPSQQATPPKAPKPTKVTTHLRINKKPEDMTSEEREEYEQVLLRRAEQSARDRQRAQERRTRRPQRVPLPPGYVPLTPVSTHSHSRHQTPEQPSMTSTVDTMRPEEIQTCIVPEDLFSEDKGTVIGDFSTTVGPVDSLFFVEGNDK